jgi:hypothetical protein
MIIDHFEKRFNQFNMIAGKKRIIGQLDIQVPPVFRPGRDAIPGAHQVNGISARTSG